ncbi:unnamed protein product [Sympodiomycopsis kandeliae]
MNTNRLEVTTSEQERPMLHHVVLSARYQAALANMRRTLAKANVIEDDLVKSIEFLGLAIRKSLLGYDPDNKHCRSRISHGHHEAQNDHDHDIERNKPDFPTVSGNVASHEGVIRWSELFSAVEARLSFAEDLSDYLAKQVFRYAITPYHSTFQNGG